MSSRRGFSFKQAKNNDIKVDITWYLVSGIQPTEKVVPLTKQEVTIMCPPRNTHTPRQYGTEGIKAHPVPPPNTPGPNRRFKQTPKPS